MSLFNNFFLCWIFQKFKTPVIATILDIIFVSLVTNNIFYAKIFRNSKLQWLPYTWYNFVSFANNNIIVYVEVFRNSKIQLFPYTWYNFVSHVNKCFYTEIFRNAKIQWLWYIWYNSVSLVNNILLCKKNSKLQKSSDCRILDIILCRLLIINFNHKIFRNSKIQWLL